MISEVRKLEPDLKILVFSTEKKPQKIKSLFEDFGINGFVSKGRMDVKELKKAIAEIYDHQKYLSHDTIINLRKTDALELTALEFSLLKALSEGVLQKYIPDYLKERDLKPNSLS